MTRGTPFMTKAPEWLGDVKNDNVASVIFALITSWEIEGEPKKISDLHGYIAESFDDLSEDEITEVCDLLIEHGIVVK